MLRLQRYLLSETFVALFVTVKCYCVLLSTAVLTAQNDGALPLQYSATKRGVIKMQACLWKKNEPP
jgi:hypothetical protein